jgi:hypothetical protein
MDTSIHDINMLGYGLPKYFLTWKGKWHFVSLWHFFMGQDSSAINLYNGTLRTFVALVALLLEALMKLVQLQWKSFLNKNLPSLMIYVHTNQCQLFHISNGIIWLTNWITLVHLNSFRPINLFLNLICVSFKNTLYIKNTLSGVLAVSWGPEIFI